jgi:hypothetical protein
VMMATLLSNLMQTSLKILSDHRQR